jgi:hypothetical protein
VRAARAPLVARLLAALVAVAGLLLLVTGILRATVLEPPTTAVGRVDGATGVVAVATAPGGLDLDGPSVRIDATAPSGGAVFVGVGREADVEAYLAQAARTEVTGVADGRTTTERRGVETSLPPPTAVDVWAVSASGLGSASLTWPDAPGRWRAVVTTDGTATPQQVAFTWQLGPRADRVPALVATGLVLLVGGLVGLVLTRPGGPLAPRASGTGGPAARAPRPASVPTPWRTPAAPERATEAVPAPDQEVRR